MWDVCKKARDAGIIVDSVIISQEGANYWGNLCSFSHLTGGLAFKPNSIEEGLKLFEQEAFLDLKFRVKPKPAKGNINEDSFRETSLMQFDSNTENNIIKEAKNKDRLTTPLVISYRNRNSDPDTTRMRRVLRELRIAAQWKDEDVKVYTVQSRFDKWKVLMKGPEGTPYENKWWYLYVTFTDQYPEVPPIFRFISIPFHINISEEGRVCLNVLDKDYMLSSHVMDLIALVKGLLLEPNFDQPISIEKMQLYKENKAEFLRKAKASTLQNAKNNYTDWTTGVSIQDQCPSDWSVPVENLDSLHSSISGRRSKRTVVSNTGVLYDEQDIKQLLSSSKHPVCVVTNQPLTGFTYIDHEDIE